MRGLYVRWVGANALAELLGLGSTLVLVAGLFGLIDRSSLPVALLLALLAAVAGAAVEGTAVGTLQWTVLRRALPGFRLAPWVVATALGAFVAWALGMIPSTLFSAMAEGSGGGAPPAEPPLALQLLLAAGMGLVLGPILGVPQWRVLRRHLPHAGYWVPANALAWMLGMPMVFLGTSAITPKTPPLAIGAVLAASLLAAGAVVGSVHGAFLVRLLRGAERT